jgi:multidrug efflux pump subunit AcrA (membrane-fusion protein)
VRQQVADAEAKRAEIEAALEAARQDAERAAEATAVKVRTYEQLAGNADAALASLRVETDAEREARRAAETAVDRAKQDADRAARELAETKQKAADRLTAIVAAQRGVFVDALSRMTRRECQQARAKQATPEKLRRWLDGFPSLHEDICLEAMLPSVRAHLAWTGSADDAVSVTTALVREHIAAFESILRDVIAGDPDDFHARLEKVLTRWESDRAASVADRLLTEEIRNVQ